MPQHSLDERPRIRCRMKTTCLYATSPLNELGVEAFDVSHVTNMADQQSGTVPKVGVHHSPSRKKLPVLPRHVRVRAWIRRCGRQFVHGWWAWELIAATVSVAAMVALVALLAEADQQQQQNWAVGNTQLTLNTVVVAIGTIIRSSLLLVVAGALNQSAWNWFASRTGGVEAEGQPLEDFETFSEAAANSWSCLKLLWRTKGRYGRRTFLRVKLTASLDTLHRSGRSSWFC